MALRGEKVARALPLQDKAKRRQPSVHTETDIISDGHVTLKLPLGDPLFIY